MVKILNIFGTRPEAIKMAPVIAELGKRKGLVQSIICSVGQHREMLDQVLDLFRIKPDFELDLMEPEQKLTHLTGKLFESLGRVLERDRPDWVLAQGDTTTAFVAGMVAYYHGIRFAHVEAGLRTGDKHQPFPEEVNRRVADLVADVHFAPTVRARDTLLREGYSNENILVTGNTVVDAVLRTSSLAYDWTCGPLAKLGLNNRIVLVTAHRRESFGQPLREVCMAVRQLAAIFAKDGVHFVFPVHLNPNVRKPVADILTGLHNVSLLEPLDYLSLVHLLKRSTVILTDSGGIQEEAPAFHVPVLVMRETTERPEGIDAGLARLVGTKQCGIVKETERLLRSPAELRAMSSGHNPYGDGNAATRIVSAILERSS